MKNANHTVMALIFNHPRQQKHGKTQHFNKTLGCKVIVSWGRFSIRRDVCRPFRLTSVFQFQSVSRQDVLQEPLAEKVRYDMNVEQLIDGVLVGIMMNHDEIYMVFNHIPCQHRNGDEAFHVLELVRGKKYICVFKFK